MKTWSVEDTEPRKKGFAGDGRCTNHGSKVNNKSNKTFNKMLCIFELALMSQRGTRMGNADCLTTSSCASVRLYQFEQLLAPIEVVGKVSSVEGQAVNTLY